MLTVKEHWFTQNGKPFFWLGDTAWLLLQKLTMPEIKIYLDNRAAKGFSVIQVTLVHTPDYRNPGGSPALLQDDFSAPNPDPSPASFWSQAEEAVRYAQKLGLYMALLPAWGSFASNGTLNPGNANQYAEFLAKRFGRYDNVLWIVGGDVRGSDAPETFDRLGRCLHEKCPGQLIGYHPFGRCRSAQWFHDREWLSFNMFQSGHRNYDQRKLNAWDDKVSGETFYGEDNYQYVRLDRALEPAKPTLDGEPSYELIPQGLHDPSLPYWQAGDVRRYAYWSLLAGAAGHTYGDNAIMQFYREGDKGAYGVLMPWQEALHNPGSQQMHHVRRLMEAIHWQEGTPAQALLPGNNGERHAYNLALLTPVAACIYSYTGAPFPVDTKALAFPELYGFWFDPVSGVPSAIGPVAKMKHAVFTPPNRRENANDWVLLLCDAQTHGALLQALIG